MKKIPTIFERDWGGDRSRVVDQLTDGCEWWAAGEGVATRKTDGMCCSIINGEPFKRREIKKGKPIPLDMIVLETDTKTGKTVGWIPVGNGSDDKYFMEGFNAVDPIDGTYELLGPKSQGGIEREFDTHVFHKHGGIVFADDIPRNFDGLRQWMDGQDIEGVVWHHPDGRMAKLKLRDFGIKRQT